MPRRAMRETQRRHMRNAGRVAAVVLLIIGVVFEVVAYHRWQQARDLSRLQPTAPQQALQQEGQTVLVHGVATTDSPLHEPGIEQPLLFVEHTRRERFYQYDHNAEREIPRYRTRTLRRAWVGSFSIGAVRVLPEHADTLEVPVVRTARIGRHTWRAVAAGTPLTVIGTIRNGQIADGDPFIITPLPPDRLGKTLARNSLWIAGGGAAALLLAAFLLVRLRPGPGPGDEPPQ